MSRSSVRLCLVLAVGTAVALVTARIEPAGTRVFDEILVALVGAIASMGAARASHLQIAAISLTVAPLLGLGPEAIVVMTVGLAVLTVGIAGRVQPWQCMAAFGLILNLLARAESEVFAGFNSLIGLAVLLPVVWPLRTEVWARYRHQLRVVGGVAFGVVVVAVTGVVIAGLRSIDDLRVANRLAREGLAAVARGDTDQARALLGKASESLESVSTGLNFFLLTPSRFVPIISQNARLLDEAPEAIESSLGPILEELQAIDLDNLEFTGGRVDLGAIDSMQRPVSRVARTIQELQESLSELDSAWLLPPVRSEFDRVVADVTKQASRASNTERALSLLPELLGASGPRRYFVAFMTPSEIRGGGGFMGNWAEVTAVDGRLRMVDFGRTDELNTGGEVRKFARGTPDWMVGYARYGFGDGTSKPISDTAWKNITMSPDFTSTGRVIADLYPQSGGASVDGVFALDVEMLSVLIELAGPVQVPGSELVLTGENSSEYLLHGQYLSFENDERTDVLEWVAQTVVDRLLSTELPPVSRLIDVVGPGVSQGRFIAYATDPVEQRLFVDLGVSGGLGHVESVDRVAISLNNASASKIDYFLKPLVEYRLNYWDRRTGEASAELRVSLTNSAPSSGLPDYVIGNAIGMPSGWSRLLVTTLTELVPIEVRVDGENVGLSERLESTMIANDVFVSIPPGSTVTIEIELEGFLDTSGPYELALKSPSTVMASTNIVQVEGCGRREIQSAHREPGWVRVKCP